MLDFLGYLREDGQVGSRNFVAVLPSVVCANEVAQAIVSQTLGTRGLYHHQGCCQLPPDLERVTDTLIGLGCNPNVSAVLVVSLGCEGTDVERLVSEIAATGKAVECVCIQRIGGTAKAVAQGVAIAQKLALNASGESRRRIPMSEAVVSIKCGGSDATSGLASNCAIGYVSDRLVDMGATVIFGETTEFIGAEDILAKRARTREVGERIYQIVAQMEARAKSMGCDMRRGQPTPGNIEGGLSTIEEKSLGAIMKSGTRAIEGVLAYAERIKGRKRLWIKDTPGREMEILTGMAAAGAQAMLFSTGRGAPQGFPIMPVLKVCGNPATYRHMEGDMDIDAGRIIEGAATVQEVGEEIFAGLVRVLCGQRTKSEINRYHQNIDIYTLGPVI